MTEKSVAFKMIFFPIHLCSESIAKTPDELSMNYLNSLLTGYKHMCCATKHLCHATKNVELLNDVSCCTT